MGKNEEMVAVSSGLRNRRQHLGVDFAIWQTEGTWVWFVINPRVEGGMIGASSNEAQAIREACLSIEEKLTVS
jgi:hypothetical protein